MIPTFQSMLARVLSVVMAGVLLPMCALAQGEQVPAEIESAEKSAALAAAIERIQKLQEQLAAAESQSQALKEALATANAESIEFSESYQSLRVKVEALGPELLEKGDSGIRNKLLSAVSDLGIVQKENERLAERLLTVTESITAYLSVDDETKRSELLAKLENELRASDQLLGLRMDSGERNARVLEAARIVSLKKEWGLAVFDVGSESGVKIGTPIEVIREGQTVATATIVDVRESISGAILTSPAGAEDPVRIGDGIRLAVETTLQNQ
ncbi:MAG: hypothetical protein O3C21_06305 [Verrucomicrobia bacterium]|nr:hypothetical protein [Verrucomicrobiota bacterium]